MKYDFSCDDLPEPYNTIAYEIGIENAVWFAKTFGGEQLYLPKYESIERPLRNKKIREEFNGFNCKELARKYGLSIPGIRGIIGI